MTNIAITDRAHPGRTTPNMAGTIRCIASVLTVGLALCFARPASAQITWLNPEDGDVVNVSTAYVLEPGVTTGKVVRSLESSDRHGEVLFHRFRVEYGLRSSFSIGVSGQHLEQRLGEDFKKGLGDSNVFAKLRIPITGRNSSLSFALRQSLTLPTGFEAERNELAPFTSRKNDYTAQLTGSFRARGIALHMSPGVILPGGDAPTFLSFGSAVELDNVLPFGLDIAGEYFTRWNMVDEKFESDVSLEAERALVWNLGIALGVKRRLLESQTIDPEIRLGLTFGRSGSRPRGPFPRHQPDAIPVRLTIDPINSVGADAFGVRELLASTFANQGPRYAEGVSVFVQSPRSSTAATGDTQYRLQMRLLDFKEGRVEGVKIPKLWKSPKAETRLFVEAILYGRDGLPISRPVVIEAKVSQGLGAQLLPMTTRIHQMVVPDEVRNDLRTQVVEKMTEVILNQTTEIISERVEEERRQEEALRKSLSQSPIPPHVLSDPTETAAEVTDLNPALDALSALPSPPPEENDAP